MVYHSLARDVEGVRLPHDTPPPSHVITQVRPQLSQLAFWGLKVAGAIKMAYCLRHVYSLCGRENAMAEPAGIIINATISQEKLNSLFRKQVPFRDGIARIGHVLSVLLDEGDKHREILIVNHDPDNDSLFLAWIMSHYEEELSEVIWPVLEELAASMEEGAVVRGAVLSTLPTCFESIHIKNGCLKRGPAGLVSQQELDELHEKFWSFASKDRFPDAARSMRRRNYHCKAFRRAWKNYVKWRDEEERPARIAAATKENPYSLMPNIFCWDGKVFEDCTYTKRHLIFPGADPFSFRNESGFYADKNFVWHCFLAENSPPEQIMGRYGLYINNPEAIWEYRVIEGVVGGEFTFLDDPFDTLFWSDKRCIYAFNSEKGLVPLPGVDASQFRIFGHCFGTDGEYIFHCANKIPIRLESVRYEGGFIWDDEKVLFGNFEIPLIGKSFRILGEEPSDGFHAYKLTDGKKEILFCSYRGIISEENF